MPLTTRAFGIRRPRSTVTPESSRSPINSSSVEKRGLSRRVTPGTVSLASNTLAARSWPRSARRRATNHSGCEVRMATAASESPSGHGHSGPSRLTERSTPFAKPLAIGRRRPIDSTVSPTAACGATPFSSSCTPRRSPATTGCSIASRGRSRTFESK